MRLSGRRKSTNVEDRRRMGGGKKAGLGIGGLVVVGLIVWLTGGNPLSVLQMANTGTMNQSEYVPTAEDEQLSEFVSTILASTEDIWTDLFTQMGKTYHSPKLVLFHGSVNSGCGGATAQTGPFYCSADRTVYIDLSFFKDMGKTFGSSGDFAWAYVIAHEIGHHVQNELGILPEAHKMQKQVSKTEANQISVKVELQADFLAGIWGHYEHKTYGSLEPGDIEEALKIATAIGDDRLQINSQGYVVPDAFNHGTSKQRLKWLKKGLESGDLSMGDTFSIPYSDL